MSDKTEKEKVSQKNKMSTRPSVPENVKQTLWVESGGFCMNPECLQQLRSESTNEQNIGEMAHIVSHAEGGGVSEDNLILLCANCHKKTNPRRVPNGDVLLRKWKAQAKTQAKTQAKKRIEQLFPNGLQSFDLLKKQVRPILKENLLIFNSYGPSSNGPETYQLWLKSENKLIANNSRLRCLLDENSDLLSPEDQDVVNEFILHADEFVKTRDDKVKIRVLLFPKGILSMFDIEPEEEFDIEPEEEFDIEPEEEFDIEPEEEFDIEPEEDSSPLNVSELQNFIKQLKEDGNFTSLSFFPKPMLKYVENGKSKSLSLNDRSRVLQITADRKLYWPHKTDLSIDSMVCFLLWLQKNNISWTFEDYCDLTILTLKGRYRVKMFYSYCLSKHEVNNTLLDTAKIALEKQSYCLSKHKENNTPLTSVDYLVNLFDWPNGPVSDAAKEHARFFGVEIYNQKQFFEFWQEKMK